MENIDKIFTKEYFEAMNPIDRQKIYELYMSNLGLEPRNVNLDNYGSLGVWADNILRNRFGNDFVNNYNPQGQQ